MNWDAIDEKYDVMRDKVMTWAINKAEDGGGPVPMDVGGIAAQSSWGGEEGWGEEEEEDIEIDAVYPTTRCYNCQGYGHMARECPRKGKGKGDPKGGGKAMMKGGVKGWSKCGYKGDGKGWEKVESQMEDKRGLAR